MAAEQGCVTAEEAGQHLHHDVCVSAYVYDVVQLQDGTRFLDVCPPSTPDNACHFTFISLWKDRNDVGKLEDFRGHKVNVRGVVQPMHGRAAIMVSHERQFHGGPPKFRPNPLLARGFDADRAQPAIADPNLRPQGAARSFMNTLNRDQTQKK